MEAPQRMSSPIGMLMGFSAPEAIGIFQLSALMECFVRPSAILGIPQERATDAWSFPR